MAMPAPRAVDLVEAVGLLFPKSYSKHQTIRVSPVGHTPFVFFLVTSPEIGCAMHNAHTEYVPNSGPGLTLNLASKLAVFAITSGRRQAKVIKKERQSLSFRLRIKLLMA